MGKMREDRAKTRPSWRTKNLKNLKASRDRSNLWKKNNPEKNRAIAKAYRRTEQGYFNELWNNIKKSRHRHNFKDYNDFFQCWLDQKAVHGMSCPAPGETMTMIRYRDGDKARKQTLTNISRDRILCTQGYSKKNLIFTTWKYNNSKNNLSPKGAKAFLRIVRERYGTDEVE